VGVFVCESLPHWVSVSVWLGVTEAVVFDRDIHLQAILSRVYFENIFCLCAISSVDGKTDLGVHIALGDSGTSPSPLSPLLSPKTSIFSIRSPKATLLVHAKLVT
jgi:hypothetical protein